MDKRANMYLGINEIVILILAITLLGLGLSFIRQMMEKTQVTEQGAFPNPLITPGAIDPGVTQDNIQTTICVSGYTSKVRPPTSLTNKIKSKQIIQYGYLDTNMSDYEEDHLIPLEIGGCPDCETNLFPQSYLTTPNARDKDKIENKLHDLVCSGQMNLSHAQELISQDWYGAYKTYINN